MNTYKKKELISAEIVSSAKGNPCGHCNEHIKKSDSPVAAKFYSKAPVYVHHKCLNGFKDSLRTY